MPKKINFLDLKLQQNKIKSILNENLNNVIKDSNYIMGPEVIQLEKNLERIRQREIPFLNISQEAKINHDGLKEISFSNLITTNFQHIDTIPVFYVKWHDSIPDKKLQETQLKKWLQLRLQLDTIHVLNELKAKEPTFKYQETH